MSPGKPTAAELDLSDVKWVVSSYSRTAVAVAGGGCRRVGATDGFAWVGDTKNPDLPPLVYTPSEAPRVAAGCQAGEFDYLLDP
ncbi:DUF397 domain-containing protein [Streptomyces goshikiensis]|uniref:DUF397 domain-containing protein n=1 Tax=Streptomyces goshikiensis TaxID=1942 RepID=UPI00382A5445